MPIDAPVSESNQNIAPLDGMSRYLASRADVKDRAHTAPIIDGGTPASEGTTASETETTAEDTAQTTAEHTTEPTQAAASTADLVLDPDTEQAIPNPTRNDRRIAKLWKREQEALAEVERLRLLLEDRNAAPILETTQTAGRPETTQALTPDQQLTEAAKARLRPMPLESEVGKKYRQYGEYVIDAGLWGGELATAKQQLLNQQGQAQAQAAQNQQTFAEHYSAQAKTYPDFHAKLTEAGPMDLGPVIHDVIINTPELSGHLTYWVATHPAEVARIKALPPGLQLVEMGEVRAAVKKSAGANASEGKPKTTSRAPAPTMEVGGPAGRASTRLEDSTNIMDFIGKRNAQISARRRVR